MFFLFSFSHFKIEYVQRFASEEALKAEENREAESSSSDGESSMSDYTDDMARDMELWYYLL